MYTYLWLREDGSPYYVGKGTKNRAWRRGSPPRERIIVQDFLTHEDAFQAEKFLISLFGRKDLSTGCLINLTDGGDGPIGYRHRKEAKEKLRGNTNRTGKRASIESCRRMSLAKMENQNASGHGCPKGYKYSVLANANKSAAIKAWWVKRRASC
jgi:hypothetical protein